MFVTKRMHPCLLALPLALAPSCDDSNDDDSGAGAETNDPSETSDLEMLANCPESDFEAPPFMGSAFDPQTGALLEPLPADHIVATTAGWAKLDEESQDLLGHHTELVIMDVFTHAGLLGASFGLSEACGAARTLTLWRDEAALMEFVVGQVHGTAIAEAFDATRAAETTHWTRSVSDQPPTWDEARAQLAAERPDP